MLLKIKTPLNKKRGVFYKNLERGLTKERMFDIIIKHL